MSAHEQMRQMLDQLMGTGRDGENNKYKVKFSDPRVCKSFLLGCCPHDILASTRMDLGDCPKIHDLALRADYEAAAKHKDYYYDIDAMEHLQAFINDCDRRTDLAKRRLAETQEELSAEVATKANRVHELAETIGKKLAKAEQLGAEGNVEESLKLMEEVEETRKRKSAAEQDYRNSMPASSYQQQKLRVCEVCSAYLGIHDNDRRLADHFGGKLHLGFIKIREKLDDLRTSVNDRREKLRLEREKEREGREEKKMEHDIRETRRDHDSRDREKRKRSKSRSRSRSRGRRSRRSRSRSRERRRRSRSSEVRSRRSTSRTHRSRSRSRSRRSRSRSTSKRSRGRRSRSKERRRSRESSRERKRERTRSPEHRRSPDHRRSPEHRRSSEKEEKEKSPKDKERMCGNAVLKLD